MRRLHVDYGEYLIRLENSGKAVFRGNKTVMARRRFPNLSLAIIYIFSVAPRVAPRPPRRSPSPPRREAARDGRGATIFKCFFHTGNGGFAIVPPVRAGRTHDKGRGKKKGPFLPPCMSGQDDTDLFYRRSLPFAGLIDSLLLCRACLLC